MDNNSAIQTKTTLLFPGQGAHDLHMLESIKYTEHFSQRYELVCDLLHGNPLQEMAAGNQAYFNQNEVSSMLTLLVSSLLFDVYQELSEPRPAFLAGYSVGQWLALYAARVISYEQLMTIIKARADLMDGCFKKEKGGMLAVIGLAADKLEQLCRQLETEGHYLTISNYNCVGQFSLAGTVEAITLAYDRIQALKPKKVIRLPVSGAWHCSLLDQAAAAFGVYLQSIAFNRPALPVINNVTGDFLPAAEAAMKAQLAAHLSAPVQWEKGIRTLIAQGSSEFVEIGYGSTLTKFGFFIDRSVRHRAFAPAARMKVS